MTFKVAVAGCTGYAGGEVLRLLLSHPDIEIGNLTAGGSAGSRLGEHHPQLAPLAQRIVLDSTAENLEGHDVVFLALPSGASEQIAGQLSPETLVIDCAADHRLTSKDAWDQFYGGAYAEPWPYGLPELPGARDQLAGAKRIAVPGCYVTCVTLTLMPALLAGLIDGHDITVAAASGTSGAGRGLKRNLLGSELFGSMNAYGVGGVHRHTPEMLQNLARLGAEQPTLSFTPMLAPMSRGIIAVCTAPIAAGTSLDQVQQAYRQGYTGEPFVRLLPEGVWPLTKSVVGANAVQVQVTVDQVAGRLIAVGVVDNLTKGTAGGAIQSMNLALGLSESTGLSTIGVAP